MTFFPDPGIEKFLLRAPLVQHQMKAIAEEIAQIARDTAPVLSGAYQAGIVVQETKSGARVFASAPDSAFNEFGVPSQGQVARFTLRRAVEAAGYRFRKRGGS